MEQLGQRCFHLGGALVLMIELNARFSESWTKVITGPGATPLCKKSFGLQAGDRYGERQSMWMLLTAELGAWRSVESRLGWRVDAVGWSVGRKSR